MPEYKTAELKSKIEVSDLHKTYFLRLDDAFLVRFLKIAKNDVKKAYNKYLAHYKMLINLPKVEDFISHNRSKDDINWMVALLKEMDTEVLEKYGYPGSSFYGLNSEGKLMLGMDGSTFDSFVQKPGFLDAALYGTILLYDYLMERYPEEAYDNGFVMMDDWKSMNLKMFTFYMQNRAFMKQFSQIISGSMPIKVSNYYILNGPFLMTLMYNAFKPFLSEKIRSRMCFIDGEELRKKMGDNCFPQFLGGKREYIIDRELDVGEHFLKIFPRRRQ